MKKLITNLMNFCSSFLNLQSNVVVFDRRLTVVRPSFDRRSTLLKMVAVLVMIFTLGVGQMWGAEEIYKTALFGSSYNSKSIGDYTSSWSATNSGFTVNIVNGNNNQNGWSYIKFGRRNNASVGKITTASAIDEAVTKVTITIDALTAANINSITLYTSTNNSTWTSAGTYTKSTGAQTVTLSSPTANLYYKVEFDCASGSTNGLITIIRVDYYHNTGGGTPSHTLSSAVSPVGGGSVSLSATSVAEGSTATATATPSTHYTFSSWSISGTGSSLSSTSANPTTVTMGTANTTVTANFTEDPTYTVTWVAGSNPSFSTQTNYAGTALTDPGTPDPGSYCPGGKVFVGWTATPIVGEQNSAPADLFTSVSGKSIPSGGTTYYAVFATAAESTTKFKRMADLSELNNASKIAFINSYSSSRYILNTSLGVAATTPTESDGEITVSDGQYWTLESSNSNWKFKTGTDYLVASTIPTSSSKSGAVSKAASGNTEWVITSNTYTSNGTPVFTVYSAASSTAGLEYNSGWLVYYGTDFNTSWYTIRIYVPKKTYSAYATTCSADPTLTVSPSSLNFGNVANGTYKELTFSLSGSNLTANASIGVSGTNSSYFTVTPSSVSKGSGTISATNITVRYTPVADGHTATVTVSSTGADNQTVSLTGNCKAAYSVTVTPPTNGTVTADKTSNVMAGETVTLEVSANSGYQLNAITITQAGGGSVTPSKVDDTHYTFTMPSNNVTVTATFMERVDFVLVKDVNDLYEDATVVICNKGEVEQYANVIEAYNSGNNWPAVSASVFEDDSKLKILTTTPNMQTFTLKEGTSSGTWAFYDGTGYICANSSSSNYMKRQTTLSAEGSFAISINTTTGQATMTTQGTYTRNTMSYNTSGWFSLYASNNQQSPVYVYIIPSSCSRLDAPTGLTASSITQTTVTLSWNSVTSASGYEISLDNGSSWTSTSTNTSYNATGLTAGTTYNWKVRATGTGDYCAKGNAASSTVTMKNAVTVTYNANGGTGTLPVAGGVVNLTEGDSYTVAGNTGTLVKDGYTWAGWHNSTTYSATPAYTVGGSITVNSNTILYANWAPKRDTFVDGVHSNATQYGDGVYTVPSCSDATRNTSGTCEETHYKFIGWALSGADLTVPANIISSGGSKAATGATYYAVWGEEL